MCFPGASCLCKILESVGVCPEIPNPPKVYMVKAQRNEALGMIFRVLGELKSSAELGTASQPTN